MKKYIKRIIGSIFVLLTVSFESNAQQSYQFTQLLQNKYILNPAAVGEITSNEIVVGFRKQWTGLENSPSTYYLGYNRGLVKKIKPEHQPLAIRTSRTEGYKFKQSEGGVGKLKHGVGGYILQDKYGAFQNLNLNLSYALHKALNDNMSISMGVNTQLNNSKFDKTLAVPDEAGDATYDAFALEMSNLTNLGVDLGVYLYSDNWFMGYSTRQLSRDEITFKSIENNTLKTHHTLIGGYTFEASDHFKIIPSTILRIVKGAPISLDVLLNTTINELINVGVGYRHQDALAVLAGIKLNEKYKVNYSYDMNISSLKSYNSGSHEITLGVKF